MKITAVFLALVATSLAISLPQVPQFKNACGPGCPSNMRCIPDFGCVLCDDNKC
ncbi:hypothetical protein PTTW11_09772 [Pyrenophora teres f. teres]|uniref:Uncharacterized protein n=1 Tax=Pyrenophora teres f. teres TaxID=97479 RepID=A0A6S6WBU9_9PLEO|nr:hypothetical protein PTTW11_09772 [Pyrenophora teres f. teres]